MKNGEFTFYTLQHRRTHLSPWLKPEGKLSSTKDKKDKEWAFSGWDIFAEPWHGIGNNWRPKYKKAHNETCEVRANTGYNGWWNLEYAVKGLRRVQKADTQGKFDYRDGYNNLTQAVRHEFRLVKVVISKQTEEVSQNDLMDAIIDTVIV